MQLASAVRANALFFRQIVFNNLCRESGQISFALTLALAALIRDFFKLRLRLFRLCGVFNLVKQAQLLQRLSGLAG